MLIAFWKPFQVLSQFNQNENAPEQTTLKSFHFPQSVVPLGRLDYDSEGLLLLTDEPELERKVMHPKAHCSKTYFAQVEGNPVEKDLEILRKGGLEIRAKKRSHTCLPAPTTILDPAPTLPERNPPIRYRAAIPTTWLQICLSEGKNRQVRRMTAAIGYPTLRLVRAKIGNLSLFSLDLTPGNWNPLTPQQRQLIFA